MRSGFNSLLKLGLKRELKVGHALPLLVMLVSVLVYAAPRAYGLDRCAMAEDADPSLELVATITLAKEPRSMAVNEETNLVYVGIDGGIIVVDGETNDVVAEVPLNFRVLALVVNPQTNRVYASGGGVIKVIDGATYAVVGEIPESVSSEEIAVNPVTNLVYIADSALVRGQPDVVHVYDGETLTQVASVEIPGSRELLRIQDVCVAVNPKTNRVYVSWSHSSTVFIIDGETHEIMESQQFTPGKRYTLSSYKVIVNPYTNYVYVDFGGGVALDGDTLEEVFSGYQGSLDAINPAGNLLYTTGLNDLYVIDGSTGETGGTLELDLGLDDSIDDLAVNPETGRIYLTHHIYSNGGFEYVKAISVVQGPLSLRPAEFVVSDLIVEPESLDVKKPFTITVKVSNTGDLRGSYLVELEFAGKVVDDKTVWLSGGESTTVTFEISGEEPGTHTVRINGQTATVTIERPPPLGLYAAIVVGVGLVVGVYFLVLRRR